MGEMIPFDYSALDKDTRGKLMWFTSEIKKLGEARTKSGMEIGRILTEAKALLNDDVCFAEWVQTEFGIGKSSAYNAMIAYKHFGDFPTGWKIQDTAMAVLATNFEATKTAKKMAAQGTFITKKIALELVAKKTSTTPRIAAPKIEEAEYTVVEPAFESDDEPAEEDESVTEPTPEEPASPPKKSKAVPIDRGTCPNCRGKRWTEGEDGWGCAKCCHPWGEPLGDVDEDQVTKRMKITVATFEAGMRELDELNAVCANANYSEAIRMCKAIIKIARDWK